MKTSVSALPTLALALLTSTVAIANASKENAWAQCRSTNSCTIEYDYLSNQEIDPFLFYGKVVDREHPQWREYRRSLSRYSDVRDCLIPSEAKRQTPNLILIDWKKMRSEEVIEVCMFRIFSSLESPADAKQWLEIQGLQNVVLKDRYRSIVRDGIRSKHTITSVSAGNLLSKTGECYQSGGFLSSILCAKLVHGETFSASWSEYNQVWNTDYSQTVE